MMDKFKCSKYYREYLPDSFWQQYIECFWEFNIDDEILAEANQLFLPDGSPKIIFVLAKSYRRFNSNGIDETVSRAIVLLQKASAVKIIHEAGTKLFGIRFKPYGLYQLLNIPLSGLSEKGYPLDDFFGREDTELMLDFVRNTADCTQRVVFIQNMLKKHLKRSKSGKISQIINYVNCDHSISVPDLAQKFAVSTSSLEKQFKSQLGLSPKNYMKIIRLNKSVLFYKNQKQKNPQLTLSGMEADFFDQSHFIKDFKQISGMTPGQYFREENFFNNLLLSSLEQKYSPENT